MEENGALRLRAGLEPKAPATSGPLAPSTGQQRDRLQAQTDRALNLVLQKEVTHSLTQQTRASQD